jgi:hypothetical protein
LLLRSLFNRHLAGVPSLTTVTPYGGHAINRKFYTQNIEEKLSDPIFTADISPLLAEGYPWSLTDAATVVIEKLVSLIPEK